MSIAETEPVVSRSVPTHVLAPVRMARFSFRSRAIFAFVAFGVGLWVVVATVIVLNARSAVEEEISSSFSVASRYLQSRKLEIQQATFPENYLSDLGLEHGAARHVRAIAIDAAGRVVPPRTVPEADGEEDTPPNWFVWLLSIGHLREDIPLVFKSGQTATIILESEPHDEIAEVWQDFRTVLPLTVVFTALLMGASILLLNAVFRRISIISAGLEHLQDGRLDVRLDDLKIPELAAIVDRFNDLAERLNEREIENKDLNRRLLTLQDEERRSIAQDLHDEIGPYIFGLRTATAPRSSEGDSSPSAAHLRDLVQAIQVRTRRLITSLRPMSLGEVPLRELIGDLVATLSRLSADCHIELVDETAPYSFGEAADLTVHRFIQESVVNAMRHGPARTIAIRMSVTDTALTIRVADDGVGPAPNADVHPGYGFTGIADRAKALGGRWCRPERHDGWTVTELRIPVEQRRIPEYHDSEVP